MLYYSGSRENDLNMREWRNRQTRTFEGRVGQLVRVQVPSLAPDQIERSGFFLYLNTNLKRLRGTEHDRRQWRIKGVRLWRSGQSFCTAPRCKETLGTARGVGQLVRVQGLGCRLGRCFCATHRGVHRTPAPRLSHQNSVTKRLLSYFSSCFLNNKIKIPFLTERDFFINLQPYS